ncbi:AAC(3) family N-acetyltransferase [Roseateles cellulosilyticus]|uniref:Aminoglycoside N(3)-acetyltransferase n=1 Tax=Pelomonas cellulosilytica TaxID=2906762 RepID=A0ABS8XTU2_9BURK|nr:AAC(3) family N-acetyltransferase [Pelomonas sp. P8]MCE4556121.1 AAC(3) family N-acetyltransferase [Pelomonas sp. P8]
MELSEAAQAWRGCGIEAGDSLLLHSDSLRWSVGRRRAGLPWSAEALLDSLLEAVSPGGTLLLPLFNFDFAAGKPFDMRSTPSHMGALTEAARRHPQAVRTGHPIYSFAVIGAHAPAVRGLDNFSGYGADSPFALLREWDGKVGVLDLSDQASMTYHHHVEEMCAAPWRYHKVFEGDYTDALGTTCRKRYGLYVRDLAAGVQTWVEPMGERLWAQGLWQGCRPMQGAGLRWVRARALFDEVAGVIRRGEAENLLYRIGEKA